MDKVLCRLRTRSVLAAMMAIGAVPLAGQAYRVPRATYMPYPFQILQSAAAMTFVYEYDGAVRNIYLKDPGPAPADSWMGKSVGHWEGETLVVNVTDLNDNTWFDRAGNFHSDKLHVVERYRRTSPDVIMY